MEIFERDGKWICKVEGVEVLAFNSRASACMVRTIYEIDGEVLGKDGEP